jgi:hypothetical protein
LRSLFLLVVVIAVSLGWTIYKVRQQGIAVAALEKMGCSVHYDINSADEPSRAPRGCAGPGSTCKQLHYDASAYWGRPSTSSPCSRSQLSLSKVRNWLIRAAVSPSFVATSPVLSPLASISAILQSRLVRD